ncbi:MAG: glycoside hydrolase family 3 protein [Caldilineaceae bacterium]
MMSAEPRVTSSNLSTQRWSRRELLVRGGGGLLAVGLIAGCQGAAPPAAESPTLSPTIPATPTAAPAAAILKPAPFLAAQPAAPSLEQMLAQMVMVGFRGTTLTSAAPIVADISERGVGSVVLFSYDVGLKSPIRNVESPEQLAKLTADLQDLTQDSNSSAIHTPLLIAADQEGGLVARLNEKHGFPPTMSAQVLGEHNDPAFTYAQAEAMARTLAAAGINHNLAPVVDINSNPANPVIGALGRSFSADPAVVIAQARAFIEAHHAHDVTTTLKHFPGHGSSQADSHLGLVDVSATWQRDELEPYRVLIGEGIVDTVMTAHVFNTQLDPTYPATLSPATITGILRDELGFDGVVITDDMNMQAITSQYGFEQAAVLAVQAGADLLAYGNNLDYDPNVAQRALATLAAAVQQGKLTEERIAQSYQRILALKQKCAPATVPGACGVPGT